MSDGSSSCSPLIAWFLRTHRRSFYDGVHKLSAIKRLRRFHIVYIRCPKTRTRQQSVPRRAHSSLYPTYTASSSQGCLSASTVFLASTISSSFSQNMRLTPRRFNAGVRHEGTPEGLSVLQLNCILLPSQTILIGGIETYVATPSTDYPKDKVILFLSDILGLKLQNSLVSKDECQRRKRRP